MQTTSHSRDEIRKMPNEPGVYKYLNKDKKIIYVGKAKNLKKRVASYFNKNLPDWKTRRMVSEIDSIEITIVNSEFDALLLENNLIKTHLPKYNIRLKDDKSFPHILIPKEAFPRVYSTRRFIPKKGKYYGPYAGVKAMNTILYLIRNIYTIRTCNLNLSPENIKKKKFKVCLEYHIGNCKGPCEGLQTTEDYQKDINHINHILKGNLGVVRDYFKEHMQEFSENLKFEQAHEMKQKLESLDDFQAKSLVFNSKIRDVDVFTIISDEKTAYVNYLKLLHGSIVVTETVEVKKKLNETDEELLPLLIIDLRTKFKSEAKEIFTNKDIYFPSDEITITIPKIGDKKKLIDMSVKNSLFYKKEKLNETIASKGKEMRVLKTLQQDLRMKVLPKHIECFDNSNIQGTNPVASMVCFLNGKSSKKNYRKYNIKTVEGPDDFASMEEIVYRRYKRLTEEKKDLPDLIVIDGGKGQLSAAVTALKKLNVYGKIAIVGIAKRLEEIYFPNDSFPLHIDKKSESLKLLQRIRDEAHRFAINFHRNQRSKNSLNSELEAIKGIGNITVDKLLKAFKSVRKTKDASIEELEKIIGVDKAEIVMRYFKSNTG